MNPDLSDPSTYGGSGKSGVYFPFWLLAIDWLFLQGLVQELPRAARGRLLELQVTRWCPTSFHRVLLPEDRSAGRGDGLETTAPSGLHAEAPHGRRE